MQVKVGGELPFCGAKLVELLGRKYSEKVRTTCALQPWYNHRELLHWIANMKLQKRTWLHSFLHGFVFILPSLAINRVLPFLLSSLLAFFQLVKRWDCQGVLIGPPWYNSFLRQTSSNHIKPLGHALSDAKQKRVEKKLPKRSPGMTWWS